MQLRIISLAAITSVCLHVGAQSLEKNYKEINNGNPISASVFCADPTALDYNGRLYIYGSNDHQQFIKNNKKNGNGYGDIKSLVVFSTDDMVNWTFHGTIDTKKICSSWTTNPWYQGYGVSWAPSVVWRTKEDGTEEFFLYFCNSSHGIGVLKANSPVGPWKSPLSRLMIHRDTPGATPCSAVFDPGVVIDENGVGWITFGGLDPVDGGTDIQPKNARIAKLKPSMTAIDGSIAKIPAPYHFEANELNVMDGKFVYTYCSNWADRKDTDWSKYKKEQGISLSKPDKCTMCYMVSDDPMNPDSWVYKGVCGKHPGFPSPNNHSHLHKFQGDYYYIYHWGPLMQKMKDGGAIDKSCDGFRSICVNKATVNEETQKINSVNLNLTGTTAIKNLNPYVLQQAETTANSGGVMYEDYKNVETNTKVSTLGNDASQNMYVKMKAGAWTMVRNADFGETGARSFMLRVKGTGKMEIRFSKASQVMTTVEFDSDTWEDKVIEVDPKVFKGKHNVFFVFKEADKVQFDAWNFSQHSATGIPTTRTARELPSARFDLSGRRLSGDTPHKGIVIEQSQDANGTKHTRKRFE